MRMVVTPLLSPAGLRRAIAAALTGLLLCCNLSGRAASLIYFSESPRALYNFDTTTGISTLRTTVGGSLRFFAMDARPSDGQVFALSFDNVLNSGLYTLDINTGAYSLVGSTGVSQLAGLAFDPLNGNLFGLRNNGGLYSLNPNTGVATFIGSTGLVDRGLAFSPSGQLFAFSNEGAVYRVDPLSGTVTLVGGGNHISSSISEDATFGPDGQLYATAFDGTLYRDNSQTGEGTIIGSTGLGNGLLALIAAPVPEPSTPVLTGLAAAVMLVARRRRRGSVKVQGSERPTR